ncbi:hypothetical protein [Haloarchaeobius sp. TZWSO28]|uniref:hypothetical protein n=1 Tax=Haloarchaeobius sp. TZWSO28 TaxID=3446119 RepID=UPI003EBCF2DD
MRGTRLLVGVAVVHLLASVAHGVNHEIAAVPLTTTQNALVGVFVFGLPLLALLGLSRGRPALARGLLLAGLLGSLAVGGGFHYLLPGADNVASVHGHGSTGFELTAALTAVVDLVGVLVVAGRAGR